MPTFRNLQRVSPVYPAPTLDGSGRPTRPWSPTSTTREAWGRLQITVGGSDFTTYRNAPTIVEAAIAEPFGDTGARLLFPAMTKFEALATGTFEEWAEVEILRLHTDGTTTTPLWVGLIAAFEDTESGLAAVCLGALHQVSLYVRAPVPDDSVVDIRSPIAGQFNPATGWRPHLRTNAMATTPDTGIDTRYRGNWETSSLDFIVKLLELSVDASGDQYTVAQDYPSNPWTPLLELKDRTTVTWNVTCGTPGVDTDDLQLELSTAANVIYGEGEYGGSRYRNFYDLSGGPFFQPFSYLDEVHPFDSDGAGGLVDMSARIDTSLVRIEAFQQFGSGVTFAEAMASAEAQRLRGQTPDWVGTIRLEIDPEEGHRLTIRAGDNIRLKHHRGSNRLFHIAAVTWSVADGRIVVILTVDTKARDLPTLAAIIERDREVARRPLARLTGRTFDGMPTSRATWDVNAGSGVVPTERAFDGTSVVALSVGWNIVKFRAAEAALIWKVEAHTSSPDTPFGLAFFNGEVTAVELPSDPFANGAWEPANYTAEDRYLIHWGQWHPELGVEERMGYGVDGRGFETNGDPLTGDFTSDALWIFTHENGIDADAQQYLWAAVYAETACSFWAKLTKGPSLP